MGWGAAVSYPFDRCWDAGCGNSCIGIAQPAQAGLIWLVWG